MRKTNIRIERFKVKAKEIRLRRMLLARRPGRGTLGTKKVVYANHFLVRLNTTKKLYHYNVTISPDARAKREIVQEMARQHPTYFAANPPIYDGENSLYTSEAVQNEVELIVELGEKDEDGKKRFNKSFTVTLKEASRPDLAVLKDFLDGKITLFPQETVQVLDLVLREFPSTSKKFVMGGRSFFGAVLGDRDIGGGIVAWKGFYMSLRPVQDGYLALNLDMTGNAFIAEQSLSSFIEHAFKADIRQLDRDFRRMDAHGDSLRARLKKLLKGLKVETNHGLSKRRYKIFTVTRQSLQDLKFNKGSEEMSVVDYFKLTYGKQLDLQGFPALECGSKNKKTYVPLELCRVVSGQNYTRKVNEAQRDKLLNMTCTDPRERREATFNAVANLKARSAALTSKFGVEINSNLTGVQARVLPPPTVQYGNGVMCPKLGKWTLVNKTMLKAENVKSWGMINFSNLRIQEIERIENEFVNSCKLHGLGMNKPAFPTISLNTLTKLEQVLGDVVKQIQRSSGGNLHLLICILPRNDNKSFYVAVKRLCEIELGVVSQCVKDGPALRNCDKRYFANVVLKINAKLGGVNAQLSGRDISKSPLIAQTPTMIIGADVSHPRPGEEFTTSVAAVVGSMDWPGFAQYETIVRSQTSRQEMIDDLFWETSDEHGRKTTGGIFKDLLTSFYNRTNHIPGRIIYYRDGVSEGQFEAVLNTEWQSLKKTFEALGWTNAAASSSSEPSFKKMRVPDGGPKVTFIVVQKRHRTCFFIEPHPNSNPKDNIDAGTVVDTQVCHPTNFDFYLCSHAGIKGTSRPAHYHVLKDENSFTADSIQQFTNDLCYIYSRCTRSVSRVPACYYADLAARRAQLWMDPEGSSATGSCAGASRAGGSRRGPVPPVRPLPLLHDRIKNTMFYI